MMIFIFVLFKCSFLLTSAKDIVKSHKVPANPTLRITNGSDSAIGRHNYMAALIADGQHVCGGSIIHRRWVLTAAHCCYTEDQEAILAERFIISAGNIYWEDGEIFRVELLRIHQNYNEKLVLNDIAMMKIFLSFEFGLKIQPIKPNAIPLDDEQKNITALVLGWGYKDTDGEVIEQSVESLREVKVSTVPWQECKKYFPHVYPSHICVFTHTTAGTCIGDSGGPLVTETRGFMQIGIVAFGAASCAVALPETYTRISSYYGWIRETVKKKTKPKD